MTNTEASLPVYQHEKRPQWGVAILAWERGDKRGYLFEDGELRVISQPYYHLMKLGHADAASLSSTFRERLAQMDRAKAEGALDPGRKSHPLFSVEEQAQLLVGQYPEGFAGEAWRKRHRADAKKKPLKRHRDAALRDARVVLDPKRVARAVTDNLHVELWKDISQLLKTTDLVTPRDLKALDQRVERAGRDLTIALSGVLQADGSEEGKKNFAERFGVFARELARLLGKAPSWPVATSLLALYFPDRCLSVHPTSLRQQARWMNESAVRQNPNALDFERINAMAQSLFDRLKQLGLEPADLFDVYDFMRATTSASAKQRLEVLRQSDLRGAAAGTDGDPGSGGNSDQEAA